MDYKKMIVELLEEIKNEKVYEYIYGLLKGIIKKWG